MTRENKATARRRGYAAPKFEDPPLLRVLVAEAVRRGDTLAALARELGVSYERVAQWRRGDANVERASRAVLEAAAKYLSVPTAYVLVLVGLITARDFVAPGPPELSDGLRREIDGLRNDSAFAGFVPDALVHADTAVQRLVLLLYRELGGGRQLRSYEWMRVMNLAALGHMDAQLGLANLQRQKE